MCKSEGFAKGGVVIDRNLKDSLPDTGSTTA